MATKERVGEELEVHLNKVHCNGTEDNINDCIRDDRHVCKAPGAGVVCRKGN